MKEQDIGFLLKQLDDRMKISADAALKESGMTISQTRVMEFVHEQGGQATQREIQQHLKVSHPTVVGIVSRLEKKEFVQCYTDEEDRRNKIVRMTDKAIKSTEIMYRGRIETEKRLLQSLSKKEVAELRRMLQILYKNME